MFANKIDEKAILNAAAVEFADKGFSGARVDAIAERAGINKAMLYYRVGDKEELYRRVVLRGQADFRDTMMKAMESSVITPETVKLMLEGVAEKAEKNRLIPSIILREIAGNGKTLPEDAMEGMRKLMEIIETMVSTGREEGVFRNIDPITLQFVVTGAVFTLSLTAQMRQELNPENPGPVTSGQIAETLGDIISHGILKGRN
jgi:AcrR family transcriptional regulator